MEEQGKRLERLGSDVQSQQSTTASLAETVKTLGSEQATLKSALDEQAKLAGRIDSLSKDVAALKQVVTRVRRSAVWSRTSQLRSESGKPSGACQQYQYRRIRFLPRPGHSHHQRHAGADCQPARADRRALSSPCSAARAFAAAAFERLPYRSKASDSPSPWSRLSFPRMVIGTQRQAGRQAVRQADAETCLVAGRHRSGQFETVARHAVRATCASRGGPHPRAPPPCATSPNSRVRLVRHSRRTGRATGVASPVPDRHSSGW